MTIHILTAGFTSPNGAAFLFPLIVHRKVLLADGLEIKLFSSVSVKLCDCDVLIVDSKYYSHRWGLEEDQILEELESFKLQGLKLIYADISDSTGWVHVKMMDIVDLYIKNQLLKDKKSYLQPIYGYRSHASFYHQTFDVNDKYEAYSMPIEKEDHLQKLKLGWNSGLANYSLHGPFVSKIFNRVPLSGLLKFPKPTRSANEKRLTSISCRFGTFYERDTVSFQRKKIAEIMATKIFAALKLKRSSYFRELSNSRLIISPFGWGEITLKDYEVFLTGGALFKPKMAHMETWPNFFIDQETILTFDWDFSNFEEKLDLFISKPDLCVEIAQCGQDVYTRHTSSAEEGALFSLHLQGIINQALAA